MQVEFKPSSSLASASELIRVNMLEYYQSRGLVWKPDRYRDTWLEYDNIEVQYRNCLVGIIRLTRDKHALYIRDLQVEAQYQQQGIGTQCLHFAYRQAKSEGLSRLRLMVFSENPALDLYKRFGLQVVGESDGLIKMEMDV